MERSEILNIIAAFIILSIVASFEFILKANWSHVTIVAGFSAIILFVAIGSKKLMALWLDADVEHKIWQVSRYGWRKHWHLKNEVSGGIIFPLFLLLFSALFSLGTFFIKFLAILTFETKPSKYRAAKRHGFYSFTEMTDWHNGLIAASGTIGLLVLSIIAYFPGAGFGMLSKLTIYYAFANMLPISKLDGTQLFFGSRVLYAVLAVVTLIFFAYALFL